MFSIWVEFIGSP